MNRSFGTNVALVSILPDTEGTEHITELIRSKSRLYRLPTMPLGSDITREEERKKKREREAREEGERSIRMI